MACLYCAFVRIDKHCLFFDISDKMYFFGRMKIRFGLAQYFSSYLNVRNCLQNSTSLSVGSSELFSGCFF